MTIFIFSGAPASGKSTVAKALLQTFPFGLHLPVDTIRNWVVSGLSDPIGSWDEETARQFGLARDSAAAIAQRYAKAGFAVTIDDLIIPEHAATHYDKTFVGYKTHKILLKPSREIALARNNQRDDPNKESLKMVIEQIYEALTIEMFDWTGWHILDTSDLSVAETVTQILERTK